MAPKIQVGMKTRSASRAKKAGTSDAEKPDGPQTRGLAAKARSEMLDAEEHSKLSARKPATAPQLELGKPEAERGRQPRKGTTAQARVASMTKSNASGMVASGTETVAQRAERMISEARQAKGAPRSSSRRSDRIREQEAAGVGPKSYRDHSSDDDVGNLTVTLQSVKISSRKLSILDLVLTEFPPCPPSLVGISTGTNRIKPEIGSRPEPKRSVSRHDEKGNAQVQGDAEAEADYADSDAETEVELDSELPELRAVVFVPSMVSMLEEPMKQKLSSKDHLSLDMSKPDDAMCAAHILAEETRKGIPELISSEVDIQYMLNKVLVVPANTVLNAIVSNSWKPRTWPYIGSVSGPVHIPDAAMIGTNLDENDRPRHDVGRHNLKYYLTFEYKTPAAFPLSTFIQARISHAFYKPKRYLGICFIWPSRILEAAEAAQTPFPSTGASKTQAIDRPEGTTKKRATRKKGAARKQERDKTTNVLMQVWGQMVYRHVNIAMLSCWEVTYFFVRRGHRLAISRPYVSREIKVLDVVSVMDVARRDDSSFWTKMNKIIDNADVEWWDEGLKKQLRDDPDHTTFKNAGIQKCTNLEAISAALKDRFNFNKLRRLDDAEYMDE